MRFWDVIHFSLQATVRGRTRIALTITAVAIGVCSVMLISTLGDAATNSVNQELNKIGFESLAVFGNNENSKLYAEDSNLIQSRIPNVSAASPIVMLYGTYRMKGQQNDAVFWGVNSDVESVIDIKLLHGRLFTNNDLKSQRNCVVVDSELAKKYYSRENIVGKKLVISVNGMNKEFEIIGIISPQKDTINQLVGGAIPAFIYLPYTTLNQMRTETDVTQIAVRCSDNEELAETKEKITDFLDRNKHGNYRAENIAGYVNGFRSVISIVVLIIAAIAAISLCVAGLGIMNAMFASVTERQKEIGVCMALGAKNFDIIKCFMSEGAFVSMAGGIIGGGTGILIAFYISKSIGITIQLNIKLFLLIEIATIICGIIFSVIPAIYAAKLDPIKTLRIE